VGDFSLLLILVIFLALLFDFSNGWHDSANAVATVISTRVLSPLSAVLMAGVLNVLGAFMSTAVAKMVGKGIIDPSAVNEVVVIAALGGAIVWNLVTLQLGLPSSSSHALIGGMIGSGFIHGGFSVLKLGGLIKVLKAMIISPFFGFVAAFALMVFLSWTFFRTHRGFATVLFRRLQLISAGFMALSHGANDAQKAMGIITLALVSAGHIPSAEVPKWVIISCAMAMGLGTALGGVENHSDLGDANSQARTGTRICRRNGSGGNSNGYRPYWITGEHHSYDYVISHGRGSRQSVFSRAVGIDPPHSLRLDFYVTWICSIGVHLLYYYFCSIIELAFFISWEC